jgi:hypothetical protein
MTNEQIIGKRLTEDNFTIFKTLITEALPLWKWSLLHKELECEEMPIERKELFQVDVVRILADMVQCYCENTSRNSDHSVDSIKSFVLSAIQMLRIPFISDVDYAEYTDEHDLRKITEVRSEEVSKIITACVIAAGLI